MSLATLCTSSVSGRVGSQSNRVKGKVVPVLNYAMKASGVCVCIDQRIIDLGTSWRWVVSFTPQPLYPRGRNCRYPLDRRLGGPQNRSRRRGEEKNLVPTGTRAPTPRPSSPQPLAIPTALSRLMSLKKTRWFLFRPSGTSEQEATQHIHLSPRVNVKAVLCFYADRD
jgi:hypothetical protein